MYSALDVELHDTDLIAEIGLLADLMVVASETAGPLDPMIIDTTLGLFPGADVVQLPRQRLAS
jgi:hypothetical protein